MNLNPRVPSLLTSLLIAGCGSSGVVQTGQITVEYDEDFDFSELETFSVVTEELVPEAMFEPDEARFEDSVNEMIVAAMQEEPVCLRYIPPDQVTEQNQPDVWAANGLSQTQEEGVRWTCVGGWWWGTWGRWWDPCRWRTPVPIEVDVGNLYIPVAPPPVEDEETNAVFAGLAQKILGSEPDLEAKARVAVEEIFQQWPATGACQR